MKYLNTKPGSIEEVAANMSKYAAESEYQQMFKKELEKAGKGIGSMTPAEKKAFFNKIDSKYTAKNEETINEKKNYKRDSNFFVNDKTDTLKKMSGRQGYNKSTLTDYLAQKSNKKENDVYFDDTDLVYKSKTVLKNAETKTVDQMLKALQKEAVDNPYAVGMAAAMKAKNDQPPLKKSTITKAHDIAKSIEKDQKEEVKEQKDRDIPARAKYSKSGGFYYWPAPVKYNRIKKFYYHPKGAKPYPPGLHTKPTDKYEEVSQKEMKKETHSFVTNKMNQAKKDAPGEKQVVDPEPKLKEPKAKMSFKEAYKKVKEAMNTVGDATADRANQTVGQDDKKKDPDIKKPKATTDAGTKATPIDTSPEVEYKN